MKYYLFQNNSVGFCRLFYLQLSSFFQSVVLFITREEIIWIFDFTLLFIYVFSPFIFGCFLLFSVLFWPPKSVINSFLPVQIFAAFVAWQSKKCDFLVSYQFWYISSRVLFVDCFFIFWPVICSTLKNDVLKSGFIHGCGYWAYGLFLCLRSLWLKYFR